TPRLLRVDTRAASILQSCNTSTVCWPHSGLGCRISCGVSEYLLAKPSVFTAPAFGCSTSCTIPRWPQSRVERTYDKLLMSPAGTPALSQRDSHVSLFPVRRTFSISCSRTSTFALRSELLRKRESSTHSGFCTTSLQNRSQVRWFAQPST